MDRNADPTSALAMIRVIILESESTDGEPATVPLAYLVDKLDNWLLQGAYLPSQWTGPEGADWKGYNRWTSAHVSDPDHSLTQVRDLVRRVQAGQPHDSDRLIALVAGLDQLAATEQLVPFAWVTTTR